MADKSTKEVLASIETHLEAISNTLTDRNDRARKEAIRKDMRQWDEVPQFSDKAERIRRNLMIASSIVVFYKIFNVTIEASNTPFGFKLVGLKPDHIDLAMTVLVGYLLAHFFIVSGEIAIAYFGRTLGNEYEWKINRAFLSIWRARWFIIEWLIPIALGIWALNLLPIDTLLENIFGI